MEVQNIVTILGTITGTVLIVFGAILKQAKKNTNFEARLQNVEDERQDIHEIKEKITEIQLNNVKYFTIMEANQKHLESVAKSVERIHMRIDLLPLGENK